MIIQQCLNYFILFSLPPQSPEAPSTSQQKALEEALAQLQREDPSLHVTQDGETGQTVLSGAVFYLSLM